MTLDEHVAKSGVLHRALFESPLTVVSGSGATFTLSNGKTIIDASCGPAVSVLGHDRPDVTRAVNDQMNKIAYTYSGSQYTSQVCEELADMLVAHRPGGLAKAIFVNSGSEATDAALKLATQYWHERGQPQRTNFISRKQSYHGNTLGALSVSGHTSRRKLYASWLSGNVSFVDPCYAYRGQRGGESEQTYVARLAQQIDDEFQWLGPDTVAAFIMEPVSGTTLGCVPAVPGYLTAVREVCDRYGALLILDEIMCGMGKTGTLHAWEQEPGFRGPDLQTIGKALGGGFVPLSAVLVHQKIFDALATGSGALMHGHTFQAHPLACAAAVAVQKAIVQENLLENVRKMGDILQAALRRELGGLDCVGDIRGRGLFWAVEFVRDRASKQSFHPSDQFCQKIVAETLHRGVNILGNLGETGEHYVDLVIISPPYTITEDLIETIVARLKEAILVVAERRPKSPAAVDSPLENESTL